MSRESLSLEEEAKLEEIFDYHSPDDEQAWAFPPIRAAAKDLARAILLNCPPCADRTAALRKLREAVMTANGGISLRGLGF